LRSKIQQT